ncbi:MAG: hypothetical protein MAG451_02843 [Anaerolineales bacterium]|nr:hypothetical protein [Anaerolineales bacterium]
MRDTYTYTARSAEDPAEMATLTLHDHRLSVELGGALLEQVEKLFQGGEATEDGRLPPWLVPTIAWLVQQALRPFSVADVSASVKGDGLWVTAWLRIAGLRLAPLTVGWKRVDNPDAARSFVKELNKRKVSAAHPGKYPGPFDYWASWVLVGFLLVVLPLRWLRYRGN